MSICQVTDPVNTARFSVQSNPGLHSRLPTLHAHDLYWPQGEFWREEKLRETKTIANICLKLKVHYVSRSVDVGVRQGTIKRRLCKWK